MDHIQIDAGRHDLQKLCERVAAFRQPILARRQISGDDVWTGVQRSGGSADWAEVLAPIQVNGRIDFLRLSEVGVSACSVRVTAFGASLVFRCAANFSAFCFILTDSGDRQEGRPN